MILMTARIGNCANGKSGRRCQELPVLQMGKKPFLFRTGSKELESFLQMRSCRFSP